jgi:hypothetical protein
MMYGAKNKSFYKLNSMKKAGEGDRPRIIFMKPALMRFIAAASIAPLPPRFSLKFLQLAVRIYSAKERRK